MIKVMIQVTHYIITDHILASFIQYTPNLIIKKWKKTLKIKAWCLVPTYFIDLFSYLSRYYKPITNTIKSLLGFFFCSISSHFCQKQQDGGVITFDLIKVMLDLLLHIKKGKMFKHHKFLPCLYQMCQFMNTLFNLNEILTELKVLLESFEFMSK